MKEHESYIILTKYFSMSEGGTEILLGADGEMISVKALGFQCTSC